MAEDCKRFQASAEWQAVLAAEDDPRTARRQGYGCTIEQSAGADFWFTRCGHGAGFWDGDWQEPHAAGLDALSKQFGNVDLYVGDDGKIYAALSPCCGQGGTRQDRRKLPVCRLRRAGSLRGS